jgi:hypothetical protein
MIATLATYLIVLIVVAAFVGIALAALKHFNIDVPPLVYTIAGILLGAAAAILAIKFLLMLL